MNYTLHQLQVFLKVVQTQSITKAAEALFMTQPAVSIQLKNFQEQFEIPLTEIIGRQLYVTDFGKEISKMAEKIIQEVYAINYKTLSYKGKLSGRLKIASVSTGKYIAPYFLSEFMKKHEETELNLDVTNKKLVIQSLISNEIDFALVSVPPDDMQINQEILMENHLVMVGKNKIPKEQQGNLNQFFKENPILLREEGSATRMAMEKYLDKNNIQIRKKIELTSNEAVKQAVIAGLGYSLMPIIGIRNELSNKELQIIPLKGLPIKTNWRIIWHKNKQFSPVADAFLQHIKTQKDKIIEKNFPEIKTLKKRITN